MSYQQVYSYVVVGGGSSGCVVASRLAEADAGDVLLLEAGEPAENNPETLSADGFIHAFANDRTMWDRRSFPQGHCGGRSLYLGSGTGMGGSGSVNGMVYTRGDQKDYDAWPRGWQWKDVVPAFEAVESRLKVKPRIPTNFTETCINAAKGAGFQQKDKLLDGELCGYLGYQTMNYDGDQRRSSYVSFIKEQQLPRLTVRTNAKVRQLIFNERQQITGLIYRREGQDHFVSVTKEVVLCSGALETPKLLMVSGIGPAEQLRRHGIDVVSDQPQVGENLQDHPNVCLFYKGRKSPDSRYPQLYGFTRVNQESALSASQADSCFVFYSAPASLKQSMKRMLPAVLLPPSLYRNRLLRGLLRTCVDMAYKTPLLKGFLSELYGIVVILGKPVSRGYLRLRSADPEDEAVISPNYYQDPRDMDTMAAGVTLAKRIASQQALAEWGNTPLSGGARSASDVKIRRWIKSATMTTFHYCGTCRMGEDPGAPVDTRLRLRGVTGVRVADASVIPETPVSALNAPSMMIGYRAAEFILAAKTEQPAGNSSRLSQESTMAKAG
ncbi:MAG: GMC family oxidoreductase [Ketobacteraceae bacterium]|nr:GMC family oxidoreductase [Ketobacteraceae bacterium]